MATTPKSDSEWTKFIKFVLAAVLSFALSGAITYAVGTAGGSNIGFSALLLILIIGVTLGLFTLVGQAPIAYGILLGGLLPIVLAAVFVIYLLWRLSTLTFV